MKKGYEIRYFIGDEPASADELGEYVTWLIESGPMQNSAELARLSRVESIIHNFHRHKHKQPLYDAVRNDTELFQLRMFREFVADVLDGSYKPTVGTVAKSRATKALRIQSTVAYFKNMGLPTHYDSGYDGLNACQLTAKRLNVSVETVKDECKTTNKQQIWENGSDRGIVHIAMCGDLNPSPTTSGGGIFSSQGKVIWALNGFNAPSSETEIKELESIFTSLSSSDQYRILHFCAYFNPHNFQLPRTQDRLEEIEAILTKRDGYELLKRFQKQRLTLQPT